VRRALLHPSCGGCDPHPLAARSASSFFGHSLDCVVCGPRQFGHLGTLWVHIWSLPTEHPSTGHLCLSVRCSAAHSAQRASRCIVLRCGPIRCGGRGRITSKTASWTLVPGSDSYSQQGYFAGSIVALFLACYEHTTDKDVSLFFRCLYGWGGDSCTRREKHYSFATLRLNHSTCYRKI
jgi:hypothetical protein